MAVDVVTLLQGSGQPLIVPWRESDRLENGGYNFQDKQWREFVRQRARLALSGNWKPTEIFLCLRGDYLVGNYDTHFIAELLKLARTHCWGEPVYLAVNWRVSIHREQPRWRVSLFDWFETVLEHGVADVIEEEIDNDRFKESDGYALSHGAKLSRKRHDELARKRHDELARVAASGEWRCVLPESPQQEHLPVLLDSFVQPRHTEWRAGLNLVTVVDHGDSAMQSRLVKAALNKYRRAPMVVALSGYGTSPSPKLQEHCQIGGAPLIECRGAFELRSLLLRHNQQPQINRLPEGGRVQKIKITQAQRLFKKEPNAGLPGLLLTSSFDADEDIRHCLEALHDAGDITQGLPPQVRYWVHPGIRSGALPKVLSEVSPLTAWVFLGHGEGARGLKSGKPDKWEKPGGWLHRFDEYGKIGYGLALAFFSACKSRETAECFAQAGVGVAIGFEAKVLPEACRLLAAEVVRAAVISNGDQQAILEAYHYGCRRLEPRDLSDAKPIAFYSVG